MENTLKNKAMNSNGVHNLSSQQAYELCLKGAVIVDVREEYLNRFKIFDVPRIIFCPLKKLVEHIARLPANQQLIFADASGIHSPEAIKLLEKHGFTGSCANLSGGLVDWEHSGLPVLVNYEERLSGQCVCQLKAREKGMNERKREGEGQSET